MSMTQETAEAWGKLSPVPTYEQPELTITFPSAKESYKVTSAKLHTEIALQPRMKVSIIATGYVAKASLDFLEDKNSRDWTVVLDEVSLSEIGENT